MIWDVTDDRVNLESVVDANLESAASTPTGHSATTVYGGHGHRLRQTVIALGGGKQLAEHESPGEATLLVLDGRVELRAGKRRWEGESGDLLVIPPERHSLHALEPSAVLLTVSLG
jgi:quercetin dioxygenase-like cupin family protein